MRGREQSPARRPEFTGLVAVALVEDLGVGDRENPGDILSREVSRVGVEIGRQRHRAERHHFAPRMEDPGEERVRHRHQRQHIDLSRYTIANPQFGESVRRRIVDRAAEIRIALDEAKVILLDPGRRDFGIGQDLFERSAFRKLRLLMRPRRAPLGKDGGDQANVEIEIALRDRRAKIDGERKRIAGALRMIDQRPQDGGGGSTAERADERPVIVAGPPLPAAVAGGHPGGVVEQMLGPGKH